MESEGIDLSVTVFVWSVLCFCYIVSIVFILILFPFVDFESSSFFPLLDILDKTYSCFDLFFGLFFLDLSLFLTGNWLQFDKVGPHFL